MIKRRRVALGVAIALSVVPSVAGAEGEPAGQRYAGLFASAGFSEGIGIGARAGAPRFGIAASGGVAPVPVVWLEGTSVAPHVHIFATLQLATEVEWLFFRPVPRADLGLSFGYRYNSLFGNGGALGAIVRYDFNRTIATQVTAVLAYFPDGGERVATTDSIPASARLTSLETNWQAGLRFALLWFP